jgi:protein required for attachment to host cells
MKLRIPHDAWVVVCDARKAVFLRNEGDESFPNLKVEQTNEAPANPSNAERGADRPGRIQNAIAPTSATDLADRHTLAELRFADETMRSIEALHRTRHPHGFILVAPPRMLAALRGHLTGDLCSAIIAEIDKDLTKHPVYEIERLLTGV